MFRALRVSKDTHPSLVALPQRPMHLFNLTASLPPSVYPSSALELASKVRENAWKGVDTLVGHIIGKEIVSLGKNRSERKNGASLPDSLTLMEIFVACFVLQDLPLPPLPLPESLAANSKVMKV